jgi:receptor protein-tyrosine kinase
MDERSMGLIQRAAARIAGQNTPGDAMPPRSVEPDRSRSMGQREAVGGDEPLASKRSREVMIDRGRLARAGVAMPSSERSRIVEEYRIIKRGVLRNAAADDGRGRLIMITSARPREGKTFTSLNLALSIASEKDMRVLLIDCDVHRRSLVEMLGIDADKGLVDLLTDSGVDIADVLLRTNIATLSVLPSGKGGPQVPELLSSNRMSGLVEEMVRRYPDRFIILDAPPCLATSDPSILAGLVGQIVFVVEANQTQEQEIAAALRLISGCPTIGLVLNKTLGAASDQFGSYSYY